MSNTEDVLDNWEEIDESRLNDQIHQIRRGITIPDETTPQNGLPQIIMNADDYYANSYTQPSAPIVTILRRPIQHSNVVKMCDTKPKQPIKTLQQREQEYAQARLRILGSAKNPEDELENTLTPLAVNSSRAFNEIKSSNKTIDVSIPASQNSNQLRTTDGFCRMPRGPDGSPGFTFRR